MRKTCAIVLGLLIVWALGAKAQDKQQPLKLIATTPLPDLEGDLEFFAADLKGNRLFLCAENSKTVEVFNLRTGKRIHTITGFGQPHDVLYLPSSNKLIVTDGDGFGMVELISGQDYKILDSIKLPEGVDEALYDPINKRYYVASGTHEFDATKTHQLSIIDTENFKLLGDMTLPGNHSEQMAVDHLGKKLYVNLRGTNEVGVIDLDSRQVIARWPVPEAQILNGLALDEPNHRVFTASQKPPSFFVFDTDTGKVVATLPCTSMNDHMSFDSARKRIYVTGNETTSVFQQLDADHYRLLAEVPTGYRAKTSLFVPELNRLYVALSAKFKPGATPALQIYKVQP